MRRLFLSIIVISSLFLGISIGYASEHQSSFFEVLQNFADSDFYRDAWQQGGERATGDFEKPQQHKIVECLSGLQDFLSSIVGFKDFSDFAEYVFDIGRINLCHKNDLDFVQQQLQRARRQVRSAFLRCEPQNVRRLAQNYYKLEAEVFFLQKAFDEKISTNVEYLLRNSDGSKNEAKWTELLNDLKSRASGWLYFGGADALERESTLNAYFQEFEAKYERRIGLDGTYNNCRSETWEEIGDKWNEFIQNFKNFGQAAAGAGEQIAEEATGAATDIYGSFTSTDKNASQRSGPILSTEEGLDLNLRFLRAKVTPEKSFRDLLTIPSARSTTAGLPHSEVPGKVEEEKTRFEEETSRAEVEAKFTTLYADISDNATVEFSKKLDTLIKTVKDSIPKLDQIESCVDRVEARECKNKK